LPVDTVAATVTSMTTVSAIGAVSPWRLKAVPAEGFDGDNRHNARQHRHRDFGHHVAERRHQHQQHDARRKVEMRLRPLPISTLTMVCPIIAQPAIPP
jgi:hypothetical protein